MKKYVLIGLLVLVLLALGGGVFIYRNTQTEVQSVQQRTDVSTEEVREIINTDQEAVKSQGSFVDGDALHKGSGQAKVVETPEGPILKFENFSVTSGPDVFVYLSPNPAGSDLGEFVSLGRIKSFEGDQVYTLPDNYQDFKTVVIWCRAFSTTFATAELQ